MKSSIFPQGLAALCIAATALSASGQYIKLFGPVNVRTSTQGTGSGEAANTFNTTILNLSCPLGPQAVISSSTDGTGNVLVDNYLSLQAGEVGPVDICKNGTVEGDGQQNCFNSTYASEASSGSLTGKDPDNFVSTGGVPPIDISSYLSAGQVQATINLTDTGGYLASSTLYLVTNCTSAGVTGPGQVTGNPISSGNPTPQQLAQIYSFNSSTNQQVQFTYDLNPAQNAGTLAIRDQSTPSTGDTPLNPANFSSMYLHDTSFATANCLLHTGELYNGLPACKLYTLTCQVGSDSTQSGALCPSSTQRNEIFQEVFDGPSFNLADHQGVGFLEAAETWTGGPCVFDANSGIAQQLCPQNVLTSFSGPGAYRSGGSGQSPNSSFITVFPVPEDLTTVSVAGQQPGYWINTHSATVQFKSAPPVLDPAANNNFAAAPIESVTYGISGASNVPQPPAPISGDTTLPNGVPCPAPGSSGLASEFDPPQQSVSVPADGQYLVHYYAQDCAGTQELHFTQSGGSWSTSFYTFPINVDTVDPVIVSGPTLSPAPSTNNGVANSYLVGQAVTATYRCTDDRSGIVKCGTSTYSPGTLDTGNLSSPVDTSKAGSMQTFTVNAVDAAGNPATATSMSYQVVTPPPANLSVLKVARPFVKHNARLVYGITAVNLGKQAASAVTITDPLPAGVTFVKASAQQLSCSNNKCSNDASCSFSNNTVSCSVPSLTLLTPVLVEIVVTVQAGKGTTIKNTATVSSANPEGKGNPQSTAKTTVQ